MTDLVKRHNGIEQDPEGVYVMFEDFERLQAENERFRVAAQFGLDVLWGSNGDKRGAISYLEKALKEQI